MSDNEKILSFDEIMAAEDITEQSVPVPQWGGSVRVRSLSYREMQALKTDGTDDLDKHQIERGVFIAGMINPKVTEEQYEMLLEKSAGAMMTVTQAIIKGTNLGDDAVKEEEKKFPGSAE